MLTYTIDFAIVFCPSHFNFTCCICSFSCSCCVLKIIIKLCFFWNKNLPSLGLSVASLNLMSVLVEDIWVFPFTRIFTLQLQYVICNSTSKNFLKLHTPPLTCVFCLQMRYPDSTVFILIIVEATKHLNIVLVKKLKENLI